MDILRAHVGAIECIGLKNLTVDPKSQVQLPPAASQDKELFIKPHPLGRPAYGWKGLGGRCFYSLSTDAHWSGLRLLNDKHQLILIVQLSHTLYTYEILAISVNEPRTAKFSTCENLKVH